MADCVFCKIAAGEIPAQALHRDDRAVAIRDAKPQAPVHFLVIPREHMETMRDLHDPDLTGHLIGVANRVAAEQGLAEHGYRVVVNVGPHGGQTVYHLHVHVLGGRYMGWPPG